MITQKNFSSMALCGGLMLGAGTVLAGTIDATESFLLDEELGYTMNETFVGEFFSHRKFEVAQAGVYELVLTETVAPYSLQITGDDPSAMSLSHLQARVSTLDEKVLSHDGYGSSLVDLQPGTYYLTVFAKTGLADANGELNLTLQQSGNGVTAVPVPAALWLLGSGLMGLIGVARRKN